MGMLIAGSAISAQSNLLKINQTIDLPLTKKIEGEATKVKTPILNLQKSTPLWSNDCSDASTFTFTNTSTPSVDWAIETDPAAIPVSVLAPMGSQTAANGYLFISSDAVPGNADGNNTPVVATARVNNTLDLSATPNAILTFASNFRWWHEDRTVRVSGDNGASWTDFEISNTASSPADGQNTLNPTISVIDISAVAGGQSQVLIEFVYDDNDIWAWYWAIDDIAVFEKPNNDIKVKQYFATNLNNDVEYAKVPLAQVTPMSFGLEIENLGVNDITNVGFAYDINDGSSSVASASNITSPITSVSGAIDSVFETTSYTPTALGTYTYTLTAVSDSVDDDPTNNPVMNGALEVTTNIWAVDDGSLEGSYSQLFDVDSTAVFKVGNMFVVQADAIIYSLDIEIAGTNQGVNSNIFGEIWSFDGSTWSQVSATLDKTLTSNDNGTWVNVRFDQGVNVASGDNIIAFAGHYGGDNTERVSFARGGKDGSVRLGLADGTVNGFSGDNPPPHVRLNFENYGVNIEENIEVISLNQNMPNPAVNNTVITYSLQNNADVNLVITDLNGKVVKTISQNNQVKGLHTFNVNVSNLANGVYQYTLSGAGSSITKSMVVAK